MDPRNTMRSVLEGLDTLPTLPEVALKVLQLTSDPEANANDFQRLINNDPALTAKILRVANSSFYGFRSKISTIKMAIVMLGMDEIARLARAFTFLSAFPSEKVNSQFDYNRFWLHNIAVSEIIKGMDVRLGLDTTGEVSTGGLLHDIGILVMASFFEEQFIQVLRYSDDKEIEWHRAEKELFEIDHTEIGEILAKRWNLPELLVEIIRYHHEPMKAEKYRQEAVVAYLANRITEAYGVSLLPLRDTEELARDPMWNELLENCLVSPVPSPEELIEAAEADVYRARDFHSISLG